MTNNSTGPEHPSLLPWYVAGRLEPEETQEVEAHLATCSSCREEASALASMRQTLLRETESGHLSDTAVVVRPAGNPWKGAFFVAAAAAGLFAMLALGMLRPPVSGSIEQVAPVVFEAPARHGASPPVLHGDGPWLIVVLLPSEAPAGSYRLRVESTEQVVTSDPEGKVTLLVRSLGRTGEHSLRFESLEAAGSKTYDYPFRIEPGP